MFSDIETSDCTNEFYNDTELFYGCSTNDNGDVCVGIQYSKNYDLFNYSRCSFFTSECSSGCQTELRQLSDSVGCCIHDDYIFKMPSVWMNCNLEQPEVCADAPNIADILAKKRNIALCTDKCTVRQLHYVFCKNLGEEYEKLNRECGNEDLVNFYCAFDKGEFCATMDFLDSYFETIIDECSNVNDGVCPTYCKNILVKYIDTVGCCVHYFSSQYPELSPDLFSACDIAVPDSCNSFSSRAVPDDFLECAGLTINGGAALQSGVYSIGLIIIGTYIQLC